MQLTNKMTAVAAQIMGDRTIMKFEIATNTFVAYHTKCGYVLAYWMDGEITIHAPDRRIMKTVKNNFFGQVRLTVWLANQAS